MGEVQNIPVYCYLSLSAHCVDVQYYVFHLFLNFEKNDKLLHPKIDSEQHFSLFELKNIFDNN